MSKLHFESLSMKLDIQLLKRNVHQELINIGFSFRAPVGQQPAAGSSMSTRMIPPASAAPGHPPVFPVAPTPYGMVAHPQQYLSQAMVYTQALPNIQGRVPVMAPVATNVPNMYIPVAPLPTGISTTNIDPTKLLEEQRRLEKERNFQLQQQRLKQFTIAGKKGSLNADNLIDSMFGKCPPKTSTNPSPPSTKYALPTKGENKMRIPASQAPEKNASRVQHPEMSQPCIPVPVQKDTKDLGAMMLECSNLTGPQKANKFQKPSVKELLPTSLPKATFTASDKARDWRSIQDLDKVFVAEKPRFPPWCNNENVPEMFHEIRAFVTENDSHAPDTNLIFPVLVSSGLPRELLGQIWELVNDSGKSHLTAAEMYAALALIAVAQAGHPVNSLDILHRLPSCPVPKLNCTKPTPVQQDVKPELEDSSHNIQTPAAGPEEKSQSAVHEVIRPTAIFPPNAKITSSDKSSVTDLEESVSSWTPFSTSGQVSSPDDDFDDFKCATPTAINFSMQTPVSATAQDDDDFDDFKQAPSIPIKSEENKIPEISLVEQDLMSPDEDKYSVFRSLQQDDGTMNWGNFSCTPALPVSDASNKAEKSTEMEKTEPNTGFPSFLITQNSDTAACMRSELPVVESSSKNDDDFGDFLQADVASVVPTQPDTDFADFSNFKQADSQQTSFMFNNEGSQNDDEFGEFASSVPVSLKPDVGQEFLFRHMKDNISLAESQSVSSLELGTFDGGGHSGESKSSLSRQDSIPSLDLKSGCLDTNDAEDCFGELQTPAFVSRGSKSPSPSKDVKEPENNVNSTNIGLMFSTPSVPLVDKYSVIRSEERKEEDPHISSWTRCLQSSLNILQNTKRIFNQMSCSSVCNEVLSSEEGGNYIRNIIEIYKVVCRISAASKSAGKQTSVLIELLHQADREWNTVCGFFAGSSLMPDESSLNFASCVLKAEPENNLKACGLCLLNVDIHSKCFSKEESLKLSYGGRNYHSPCANFWVNCVDPLLPALPLPQLL
ncbi:synergin gamma-like [Uloborus diversus]|uniref:synergin gamma-like n=1 Tax=Uloborus diversus TaxID=327109 RepID=UPI002409A40A|nr:synergin gamma-like [Uloborus diversus]